MTYPTHDTNRARRGNDFLKGSFNALSAAKSAAENGCDVKDLYLDDAEWS